MNIVFFPFHDYKLSLIEGFRTRDSHIYSQAIDSSSVDTVVMVNRPTLFLEVLLKKKKFKTGGTTVFSNSLMNIQKMNDKLFVIDIIDFSFIKPIFKGKAFISELYYCNRRQIKEALDVIGCSEFLTYESSPLTRKVVNYISPKAKVFDGVDNFCKHDSYATHKSHLKDEYIKIINSYDKIFFNSEDSLEYFNCANQENVEFMANGVDSLRFQNNYCVPDKYAASHLAKRKVAVYAGKMQSMFDIDLVKKLAIDNADIDFFFLGKILEGNPDTELEQYSNVIFVGDVHYDLLPAFITNADVCVIPYHVNKQHGGDPIKFYEYLASGNPIVSTCIGDIHKYHDGESVFIVDKKDFLFSFKMASSNVELKKLRIIPEHMSWKYKTNYMFDLL